MSWLRVQRKGSARYWAIVRNQRRGGRVVQRILEWLGRDPDPRRLRRALRYWRVDKEGRRR